eukprot:gene46106-61646_t
MNSGTSRSDFSGAIHRPSSLQETPSMSQKQAAAPTREAVKGVQKMTPSEAFVETMVANGVTDIFGIMGSAFMDAMDIFAPAGIRLIPAVHEQSEHCE